MGNDGGSIPRRREVVKQQKREERKENYEIAKAKARLCALSKEPLRQPIGMCRLGLLYNKEEVIKRLIEKTMPKAFRHIRKLKDIKEIKAEFKKEEEDGAQIIVCPVSKRELNGFHPFLAVWGCGCVLSEEAAKELKISDTCIHCGSQIEKKTDIISLCQSIEQQAAYLSLVDVQLEKEQVSDHMALTLSLQKSKSKKNGILGKRNEEEKDDEDASPAKEDEEQPDEDAKVSKKPEMSEAYKSLFKTMYEENKDRDFLCRSVHRGLR